MKNRADAVAVAFVDCRIASELYKQPNNKTTKQHNALSRYPSLRIELITLLAQLELEDIIPAHYAERLTSRDLLTA